MDTALVAFFSAISNLVARAVAGEINLPVVTGVLVSLALTTPLPSCPSGYEIVSHNSVGIPTDASTQVELYQSDEQKKGGVINARALITQLKSIKAPMLGADAYDYYAADFSRIPKAWEGKVGEIRWIIFGNTEFRRSDGNLCVRALLWNGLQWDEDFYWLDGGWGVRSFVAILASSPPGSQA